MSPGKQLGGRVAPEEPDSTAGRSGFHPLPRDVTTGLHSAHSTAPRQEMQFLPLSLSQKPLEDDNYSSRDMLTPEQITRKGEGTTMTISCPSGWRGVRAGISASVMGGGGLSVRGRDGCWVGSQQESQRGWEVGVTGKVLFLFQVQTGSLTKSQCPYSPGFGHQPCDLLPLRSHRHTNPKALLVPEVPHGQQAAPHVRVEEERWEG